VSAPGGAARINVEKFGGDVTNLADRTLARLFPLIAAEAMQWRVVG